LLADGDHYVMPIWYEQTVQCKRPDVLFQPSVFLYHNWGWVQVANRDSRLGKAVLSTPLLMDRLKALTDQPSKHSLFYSLGRDYLEAAFQQLPGEWIPRGLVWEWRKKAPARQAVVDEVRTAVESERFRGVEAFLEPSGLDPSTGQIRRYYSGQYYLATRYLKGRPSEGSKP